MNKELQICMNDWCMTALEHAQDEFMNESMSIPVQLRYCQARVYETTSFYILESYNTNFVAIIDKDTKQCYDLLRYVYRYTNTSAQHISKFCHDYGDNRIYRYTYREI